jgi:hypothetical protein
MVKYVFLLKIVFTITGIIPYLFFPNNLIVSFGIGSNDSVMYIRSLGFAYFVFLLVYCSGYFQIIRKNIYPINIILFAILTNGGGLILSVIFILMDEFDNLNFSGKVIRYGSGFLFFFIALMLIISVIRNYNKYKNEVIWNKLK